jgi:NAD(P)H dehydrogenase (quinone)
MSQAPILVTGGTGRQGGTGHGAIRELLTLGHRVRAMVRSLDERSEALKALGAELVVGEYANFSSLNEALEGVAAAYFVHPVAAGIAEAAGLFAGAAKAQGVNRIVDLSLGSTSPTSLSPQLRAQWVAEQIFETNGIHGVHLRMKCFFLENLLLVDAPSIRFFNRIANAWGDTPLSWLSGSDVGAMAAHLLIKPSLTGERTVTAGGGIQLSYPQIAAELTRDLGRPISYEELSPEQWRQEMIAGSKVRGGEVNVRGIEHLVAQAVALRGGPPVLVTDHTLRFTGRPATSLAEFLAGHAPAFAPASLP